MTYNYVTLESWIDTTQPYVKSIQLFRCPTSVSTMISYGADVYNGSYGANTLTMPVSTASPNSVKMASLQSVAKTYMVMDSGIYYARYFRAKTSNASWEYTPGMGDGGGTCAINAATYPDNVPDCKSGRHFGGVNIAFADGHVKWLKSNIVVEEAKKCNDGVNSPSGCPTDPSAWNPAM